VGGCVFFKMAAVVIPLYAIALYFHSNNLFWIALVAGGVLFTSLLVKL